MRNLFNSVRLPKIRRNSFPLTFSNDFDTDFGLITPTMMMEVLGGEIWQMSNESFVRSQPLRAPAFTASDVSYHWFFVPNRLIYEDWTKFIVRGDNGDTDYDKPYCTIDNMVNDYDSMANYQFVTPGSLFDFLNFPTFNDPLSIATQTHAAASCKVDMMPFNVYNLVYNEYFRDENLQPEVFIWKKSGSSPNVDAFDDYVLQIIDEWDADTPEFVKPWHLRHRAWRKDYFTSALPFVQKGTPISLAGTIAGQPAIPVNFQLSSWQIGDPEGWFLGLDASGGNVTQPLKASSRTSIEHTYGSNHYHDFGFVDDKSVSAFISLPELQTSVMTISDLRVALALQQWFELNARTGSSRYFEYLLGHFGVRDRDSRLQRPEYIGGYSHSIQISEVEQNSSTDDVTPQGNLAGRGLGFSANKPLRYRCPEHGWIMCVQSIRPRAVYWQGWPRKYQRWDAFDYYDQKFDHLSEQAIKQSEIFFTPGIEPLSKNDPDFGFTPRFSEYRTALNELHGNFRADLQYWVSPRKFKFAPRLNSDFISIDGYPQYLYEMFAYPGTNANPAPHFVCHIVNHVKAIRPMSKYATPYL